MSEAVGATYAEGLKRGLRLYRAPDRCRRGHDSPRYVSSRSCVECCRARTPDASATEARRPRRKPKPVTAVAAVVPVRAPEPTHETRGQGVGSNRHHFKHGGWADTVRIDEGTAKRISDCIERIFGNAPRIGHERQRQDEAA
jgi:hypothetical protein